MSCTGARRVRPELVVLSGPHELSALERTPHTHLIASVAGLPELLLRG